MASSELHATPPLTFLEERLVASLYGKTHLLLIKHGLLGLCFAVIHWSLYASIAAIAWYAILIAVLVGRYVMCRQHSRVGARRSNSEWLKIFRCGVVLTAILWGITAPLLLADVDLHVEMLLAFIVSWLTAYVIVDIAPDRFSYTAFLAIVLMPLLAVVVGKGDEYHFYMALTILFFAIFTAVSAQSSRAHWLDNLRLSHLQETVEQELLLQKQLADISARAQATFIQESDRRMAFNNLLTDILTLTQSEYGFIGETLHDQTGAPYLKTHAITNISWSTATEDFYQKNAPSGLEFTNLKTLFGAVLTTGKTVISNQPAHDPRSAGLPEGHPPLHAFLGIPVSHSGKSNGVIGLANRPHGYDEELTAFLQPLLTTIGLLIEAARSHVAAAMVKQALIKQAQHTQTIIDNMIDGLITIDSLGKIRLFNPAAERIFGYKAAEIIDQNVTKLMPQEHAAHHHEYLESYQATGIAKIIGIGREVEGVRRDGSRFPMNLSISEINNNGQAEYLGMVSDITERKRLDNLKNEFVSIVSHELRTPLTSITGALGLVTSGSLGGLPDNIAKMINIAHKNSLHLGILINDLLDMEKLVAGKMHFDMALQPLQPLLLQVIKANQPYAENYGVSYELVNSGENPWAMVDGLRFQQILANFLSNAAKFSPKESIVKIGIDVHGQSAKIYVKDQGAGIPENFKERIFGKFAQADSSDTRKKGGTGLGLAICKELIERMDGSIGFESLKPKGTCFYVTLKVHSAPNTP